MSDKEKIIARLKEKGFLDEESISHLKSKLKKKLAEEEEEQKKEITFLKEQLYLLRNGLRY